MRWSWNTNDLNDDISRITHCIDKCRQSQDILSYVDDLMNEFKLDKYEVAAKQMDNVRHNLSLLSQSLHGIRHLRIRARAEAFMHQAEAKPVKNHVETDGADEVDEADDGGSLYRNIKMT